MRITKILAVLAAFACCFALDWSTDAKGGGGGGARPSVAPRPSAAPSRPSPPVVMPIVNIGGKAMAQTGKTTTGLTGGVQPIDDPDHRLTDAEHAALMDRLAANYNATKVHVVVWLPTLAKEDVLAEKAVAYFKAKGIGQKDLDNGVLLLVDWPNHRSRIEVGYGLEGIMTDAATKQLQDTVMAPLFRQGNLAGGLMAGVDQLAAWSAQWAKEAPAVAAKSEGHAVALIVVLGAIGLLILFGWAYVARERRIAEEARAAERRDAEARMRAAQQRVGASSRSAAAAAAFATSKSTSASRKASDRKPSSSSCSTIAAAGLGYAAGYSSHSSCSSRSSCSSSSSSSSYDSGGGSSGGVGSDSSFD